MHRPPVGGGPGVAAEHAAGALLTLAGDAVELADDDGRPGHLAFAGDDDEASAGAFDAALFRFEADHEAGLVGEGDERKVEGVAELDEAHHLFAASDIGRGAEHRVIRHDADRVAIEPGEARDPGAAVERRDFEEGTSIDDGFDDLVGIVCTAPVARDDGEQALVTAAGVIGGHEAGCGLPDVRGEIAEEAANHGEGIAFRFSEVIDDATLVDVDLFAAEILLRDVVAEGGLDDGGAAREELAHSFDHDVEVTEASIDGGETGNGAEDGGDDRDDVEQLHVRGGHEVAVGEVGAAHLFEGADAAAGGVEEADVGKPPFEGPLVRGEFHAHAAGVAPG